MIEQSPASSRLRRQLFLLALAGLLLAPAVVFIDASITNGLQNLDLPSDLRKAVSLGEVFGHGSSVALILLAVLAIDAQGAKRLPALATMAFGGGLLADAIKLLVARVRPDHSDLTQSAFNTFLGWRPLLELIVPPGHSRSMYQSFPSGHTATAVGLAIGLSLAYPRGRWYFAAMACLTMAQRVMDEYHFLSDTIAGASIAIAWCALLLPRLERRLTLEESTPTLQAYPRSKAA
jgi:membrane-associated phospholipid phosphatase